MKLVPMAHSNTMAKTTNSGEPIAGIVPIQIIARFTGTLPQANETPNFTQTMKNMMGTLETIVCGEMILIFMIKCQLKLNLPTE